MSPIGMKLKPATLAMALSAAFPVVAYAAAGRIDFAIGEVKALAADGRGRPLAKGDEFNSGETIETGNGRAWLRFTDGAQVSLQPQSQYRIDNYKFMGAADGEERGFFSLLKGGLRTITGLVGRTNRKNYNVSTAVATIGIRGTEYSITYGNSITVSTGEGVVEVCNAAGCLTLNSGETGYVAGSDIRPVLTDKKADLPPPPQLPPPVFSVANNTNGSGGAAVLGGTLPSGPGYAMAWASPTMVATISTGLLENTGTATFDGSSALAAYSGSSSTYSPSTFADVGTNGVIGWGRWVSGNATLFGIYSGPMTNIAYVVGVPTPAADMAVLQSGGITATYSLIGGTTPIGASGSSGTLTSGSLTADFLNMKVAGNIGLSMNDGHTYVVSWLNNESIANSKFTPGTVYVAQDGGGAVSGGSNVVNGFFAGAGASSAGFTYRFLGNAADPISGAAAFHKN